MQHMTITEWNARQDLRRKGLFLRDLDEFDYAATDAQLRSLDLRYAKDKFRSWDEVAWYLCVHPETARRNGLRGLDRISAEKERRRTRPRPQPRLDPIMRSQFRVDEVLPNLFQSGLPNEERLNAHNIGFVVDVSYQQLMWKPEGSGRSLIKFDLHDSFEYLPDLPVLFEAAKGARDAVRGGIPTLVHCQMGWNRSGIVNGVAVWMLTGKSGTDVVGIIKKARPEALVNTTFRAFIERLPSFEGDLSDEDLMLRIEGAASLWDTQSTYKAFGVRNFGKALGLMR